jgi:hypothetical protein
MSQLEAVKDQLETTHTPYTTQLTEFIMPYCCTLHGKRIRCIICHLWVWHWHAHGTRCFFSFPMQMTIQVYMYTKTMYTYTMHNYLCTHHAYGIIDLANTAIYTYTDISSIYMKFSTQYMYEVLEITFPACTQYTPTHYAWIHCMCIWYIVHDAYGIDIMMYIPSSSHQEHACLWWLAAGTIYMHIPCIIHAVHVHQPTYVCSLTGICIHTYKEALDKHRMQAMHIMENYACTCTWLVWCIKNWSAYDADMYVLCMCYNLRFRTGLHMYAWTTVFQKTCMYHVCSPHTII